MIPIDFGVVSPHTDRHVQRLLGQLGTEQFGHCAISMMKDWHNDQRRPCFTLFIEKKTCSSIWEQIANLLGHEITSTGFVYFVLVLETFFFNSATIAPLTFIRSL